MAHLTGLFQRGSSYYLRVVLPKNHPLRAFYKSGKIVTSLGQCSRRDASIKAVVKKAELLSLEVKNSRHEKPYHHELTYGLPETIYLLDIYKRWKESKPRSTDSANSCLRALKLYEEFTGNPPIKKLTRAQGDAFRTWLQQPERKTTSKTAKDRLTWVKSLLRYAYIDLELLERHPWDGIDIQSKTTNKRRPWNDDELRVLFGQELYTHYKLPTDWRAGGDAAYWIPLIGLYTGARVSEIAQLKLLDIMIESSIPLISITNEGLNQQVKTAASIRKIPIHTELIRLGFLEYVSNISKQGHLSLWPNLRMRRNKPGGYFSNWFGEFRKSIGLESAPDFHAFRHLVRTKLVEVDIPEHTIDNLLGHEIKGSTGAKVYSHKTTKILFEAIESIQYKKIPLGNIQRTYTR